jgi:N-acetylmuramic acid 6-phosphate (MurNAc-6-P) etherase
MSDSSRKRSEEFLAISDQFKLGALTTESSHPITGNLSDTAKKDIKAALKELFDVDKDVLGTFREFVKSGRASGIQETVIRSLKAGGRLFFTGCGSTGRLSIQVVSIWRDFWQKQKARGMKCSPSPEEFEHRAFSVMAGGDFALIKAVEGFEDFTEFGKKQIGDLGLSSKDVVFAITEGGETSFVIGTAWKGVEAGAKVYFVYNNPDDVLCKDVKRSREVIQEPRIEKINLTTGPMAITGSTRMQATTIQLCVLLTILEMVLRGLCKELEPAGPCALESEGVPSEFLRKVQEMHDDLESAEVLEQLARLVALEETVYRSGHKNNYFADRFGIDVLTDTTERSPTYCTPPFRKFDDKTATESWAFLFVPQSSTPEAWERIIKRKPHCVEWTEEEIITLVSSDKVQRTHEIVKRISYPELMRFRIGLDGLSTRPLGRGDCAVGIASEQEKASVRAENGFHGSQLEEARRNGASTGLIYFGSKESLWEIRDFLNGARPASAAESPANPASSKQSSASETTNRAVAGDDRAPLQNAGFVAVLVPLPKTDFLLDGVTRLAVKTTLNTLSTCTMVRLGRVMGNYMIWVVPSNLKLIDRSTRYIQKLTGLDYREANELLFEVIEYVEPRMKADQAYPPVVGVSVMRARHRIGNEAAEERLKTEMANS